MATLKKFKQIPPGITTLWISINRSLRLNGYFNKTCKMKKKF